MSTLTPALPPPVVPASPPACPAVTFVINGEVRIPANFPDHEAFRRWARSDECPEKLRLSWINGVIWVETSPEELYTHNQVKGQIGQVLGNIVEESGTGLYCLDGMLLSHPDTGFSAIPDGLFVSYDALQSGRVRQVPSVRHAGAVELVGSPKMVLEVLSASSEEKDFHTLPGALPPREHPGILAHRRPRRAALRGTTLDHRRIRLHGATRRLVSLRRIRAIST